jgi:hypothetical protein
VSHSPLSKLAIALSLSTHYRAGYFFGAMDTGIDAAKKTTPGFNGIYASIGIGMGN